jgi:putative addiction module antidote
MSTTVKLTTIGNSTGIILPKELLEKLRVGKGDILHVLETPNGIELTSFDPQFAAQMDVAEGIMRKRRNLLKKLAE